MTLRRRYQEEINRLCYQLDEEAERRRRAERMAALLRQLLRAAMQRRWRPWLRASQRKEELS